jgi:hypothetical protein
MDEQPLRDKIAHYLALRTDADNVTEENFDDEEGSIQIVDQKIKRNPANVRVRDITKKSKSKQAKGLASTYLSDPKPPKTKPPRSSTPET